MTDEEIRSTYRGLTNRDMPFSQFRQAIKDLEDPAKLRRDLARVQALKKNAKMINSHIGNGKGE